MGISTNSHEKIDKETQSPLLKIFKEIMTREKDDPEKRNLLTEHKEDKKRRQYSGSRSKTDRRSCESSSSEHRKRSGQQHVYKSSSTEHRDFKPRTQSIPYQSEKKDSWWFWSFYSQQNTREPTKKPPPEETCSCVSCAFCNRLKKVVSTEYACVICLLLLFTITIVVAFLIVFKSVPMGDKECKCKTTTTTTTTTCKPTTTTCKPKCMCDSERLKRKIEMLNENRKDMMVDDYKKNEKKYDDPLSKQYGIPGVAGIDFGPSFRELNSLEESDSKMSSEIDWSNVLDSDKNTDFQSAEKLREFYKKLVQTDAKIKTLKRLSVQNDPPYIDDDFMAKPPERAKRSLKINKHPPRYVIRHRRSVFNKHHNINEKRKANGTRMKRFGSDPEEPTGFVIEKKKLIVQYKPVAKTKLPVKKCSHAPKDQISHTHENQLKHPFYKNTQRLDELLDRFLNKNLPELMTDPFGLDTLFNKDKENKLCKHPNPAKNVNIIGRDQLVDQIPKPRLKYKKVNVVEDKMGTQSADLVKMLKPEASTQYEKAFYNHEAEMMGQEKQKIVTSSPSDFEVLLSVSTIMNPDLKKTGKVQPTQPYRDKEPLIDKVPNIRRLMQLETGEDDENLGYEDFKEVLTDDMEGHDDMDKAGDRRKRMNDQPATPNEKVKYNPPGVHNPNWKGPMPLYPDELNSMIRHSALNVNKVDSPPKTHEIQSVFLQRKGRDLSDVEYVEDYLKNKYESLVEMAQAYSDYGVLDGKKDARNEKNSPSEATATDHRIKLSVDDGSYKAGLLGRLKRGRLPNLLRTTSPGVRLQRTVLEDEMADTSTQQTANIASAIYYTSPYNSEGIRFELRPTTKAREDDAMNVIRMLSKHLKIKSSSKSNFKVQNSKDNANAKQTSFIHSTLISSYPDMELVYSTKSNSYKTTESTTMQDFKSPEDDSESGGLIFALGRGKRNLLSTDFNDYPDANVYRTGTLANGSAYDQFVDKFNMKQDMYNATYENDLEPYIERVTQNNIEVFSTAHPFLANYSEHEQIVTSATTVRQISDADSNAANLSAADTIITINNSEIRRDFCSGNGFLGKILLTVKNPVIGVENVDVQFDLPIIINFNDELMMMNDNINFPFELFTESPDLSETEFDSYFGTVLDNILDTKSYLPNMRNRRESKITATLVTVSNGTKISFDNPTNVTDIEDSADTTTPVIPDKTTNVTEKTTTSTMNVTETTTPKTSSGNESTTIWTTNVTLRTSPDLPANSTGKYSVNYSISLKPDRSIRSSESENMTLSDFFSMVSDWFKALEGVKLEKRKEESESRPERSDMIIFINSSNESNLTTTEPTYAVYDTEMIENIGHRSRVLLSVDDDDKQPNITREMTTFEHTNITSVRILPIDGNDEPMNITSMAPILSNIKINVTAITSKAPKNTFTQVTKKKANRKAVFKRNAEDSNLIFWNDIYDDEYGIQNDKLDNSIRDKHSVKENDFIKRSGRWVHDKIKKFAENLKINPHTDEVPILRADEPVKQRMRRSVKRRGMVTYPRYIYDRLYDHRREADEEEEDYDVDQKTIFTQLSANMKNVCKQAAKAVEQTRNVPNSNDNPKAGREENTQGSIASALMQQLVRLLTDLVDYQVQQKTCTKLPPDLQSFLEWLTYPKDDAQEHEPDIQTFRTPYQEEEIMEELQDLQNEEKVDRLEEPRPADKAASMDIRTHYLDCLHSVQDLLDSYEELNDDEKSKMSGVKTYLENQMQFLNRQLSGYDLFTYYIPQLFEKNNSLRYKRELHTKKDHSTKHRPRRKLHKFIKNFGKKHTRTTASYYDGIQLTMKRKTVKNYERIDSRNQNDGDQKLSKRNLKDVYYKAVAEAKKYATVKNIHKKDEITHFQTSTSIVHH
nr:uncharacterized protein LOC110374901 isoform X2 [Helicoverpa armigera]